MRARSRVVFSDRSSRKRFSRDDRTATGGKVEFLQRTIVVRRESSQLGGGRMSVHLTAENHRVAEAISVADAAVPAKQ